MHILSGIFLTGKTVFMDARQQQELKKKLYVIIFQSDTPAGKQFDVYLLILILFSVFLAAIESIVSIHSEYNLILRIAEWVVTILFTIEYALRIYCSPDRKKYILSFYGIIDLLAVLPSFIAIIFSNTRYLIVIRALRLLRVFRIFKLTHILREGNHLMESLKKSFGKLLLFSYFIIIMVTILGALMYMVEAPYNPAFSNIPRSIYWAIVTITTVGYGDITPVTLAGQLIASIVMLLGYSIIAVPTGIISADIIRHPKKNYTECPNCHTKIHEHDARYCKNCGQALPAKE